jgi:hypothetical protein
MDLSDWWSIEVMDAEHAEISAVAWRDTYVQALSESLVTNGAVHWEWCARSWGVVLEVSFPDEEMWLLWRALPGTQAALDAVPDPVGGLMVQRGRGGAAGGFVPRVPRIDPTVDHVAADEPFQPLPVR